MTITTANVFKLAVVAVLALVVAASPLARDYALSDKEADMRLFQTAAVRFGHSLGLSDDEMRDTFMEPETERQKRSVQLDLSDDKAIQLICKALPVKTPTKKDLCNDPTFDAITTQGDGNTYVFKGSYYWKLIDWRYSPGSIAPGYPRSISKDWNGLPDNLDAAVTIANGTTYFFKGSQYWSFNDMVPANNYPQLIQDDFPGIPIDLDAALVWSKNKRLYFMKGQLYWSFHPESNPPVHGSFPKGISHWRGVPDLVQASLHHHSSGVTYFFRGNQYWRYNDETGNVDGGYPQEVGKAWFGCSPEHRSP